MIIVCDDERERLLPLVDILKLLNYDAQLISKAHELPGFLAEHHADVLAVLLDIRMPNGELLDELARRGYEVQETHAHAGTILYQYIRDRWHIPVVVHSVLRDSSLLQFFEEERVPFIAKPASSTAIVEELEKAIGRGNG